MASTSALIYNQRLGLYTNQIAGSTIVEFQLQWRRPLLLIKNLNDTAPKVMYGNSTGSIRMSESNGYIDEPTHISSDVPGITTITVSGTPYEAFSLGSGIATRQVAPRAWVVDKVTNYTIAD